jgi:hypothetical protein
MCPADQASFIVSSVVYRILSPDIYFGKTVRPMYISFNSGCGWVTGDRNNKHYINGNLFWLCRISRKFLLASVYYSPVYQYFISNFCEYSLRQLSGVSGQETIFGNYNTKTNKRDRQRGSFLLYIIRMAKYIITCEQGYIMRYGNIG